MIIKVGIRGFGRIWPNVFRAAMLDETFKNTEIAAVNDLTDTMTFDLICHMDRSLQSFN